MGFRSKFNKMKSFLFDDVEENEEINKVTEKRVQEKEVIKPKKIVETKKEDLFFEDVSDMDIKKPIEIKSRTIKNENEFVMPEFNDNDFSVPEIKPEVRVKKEEPKRVLYQGSKRKEETKKFKPSPIISPVYGLLDKEGNTVKKETKDSKEKNVLNDDISIDDVRKKAYGLLDNELENTIKRLSKKTIEEAEKDMEEEEKLVREKKNKEEYEDSSEDDMILPNINFKEIDVDKVREEKKVKEKETLNKEDDDEDTKEQDLFNLIDSVYQNKENK